MDSFAGLLSGVMEVVIKSGIILHLRCQMPLYERHFFLKLEKTRAEGAK
jgi:hypothetical protein